MLTGQEDDEFDAKLMQRLRVEDGCALDGSALDGSAPDGDAADLAAMAEAMKSYRAESLDWAEKQSAVMPSPLPLGVGERRATWMEAPQWALGLAGLCACIVGGAVYTHHQAMLVETAATTLPSAPTAQALVADNQLLALVDTAVRSPVEPSEQELGLTGGSVGERVRTHRHAQQRAN